MGEALIDLGRYNEAIIYLEKSLKLNPNDIDALSNMGSALIDFGRYNEAIKYLEKVL